MSALHADVEVKKAENVRSWLNAQNPFVSGIVAHRAALRSMPICSVRGKSEHFIESASILFRAAALGRFALKRPKNYLNEKYLADEVYAQIRDLTRQIIYSETKSKTYDIVSLRKKIDKSILASSIRAGAQALDASFRTESWAASDASVASIEAGAICTLLAGFPTDTFWSCIDRDIDATIARGTGVIDASLWWDLEPSWSKTFWVTFKDLLPSNESWGVWTTWYEARVFGRIDPEGGLRVYACVPSKIWQGVDGRNRANRNIIEKLEELAAGDGRGLPRPIPNVPSPFTFAWSGSAQLTIVAGPQNIPNFPFANSERDHLQALDTARRQFQRLLAALQSGQYNVRPGYGQAIKNYLDDLPSQPGVGNILLADSEARILRDMFAADASILPDEFAARLRAALQQQIGLRAFYPEVERFYASVLAGRLEEALPQDAVEGFAGVICAHTPIMFEPEVSSGFSEVEREPPAIELDPADFRASGTEIQPQPDPLGHLDRTKSREFTIASAANSLYEAFLKGKDMPKAITGWSDAAHQFAPHAEKLIEWLRNFLAPPAN